MSVPVDPGAAWNPLPNAGMWCLLVMGNGPEELLAGLGGGVQEVDTC